MLVLQQVSVATVALEGWAGLTEGLQGKHLGWGRSGLNYQVLSGEGGFQRGAPGSGQKGKPGEPWIPRRKLKGKSLH